MKQVHTSYKFSKRLKEFLGEGAPEPMEYGYYTDDPKPYVFYSTLSESDLKRHPKILPAYQLHDLLTTTFCKAMVKSGATQHLKWVAAGHKKGKYKKLSPHMPIEDPGYIAKEIFHAYYFYGGMAGVESVLHEMMHK